MAIVSVSRIQHRRGLQQDLPQLASAELGWSLDSQRLFIGNGTLEEGAPRIGNTEILTAHSDILQLAETYTYKNEDAGYTPITGKHNSRLNSVAYGSNLYVAVGINGYILTSYDLVTWTPVYGGTDKTLNSICYGSVNGQGTFVAVGAAGTIIYSTDGAVWHKSTNNAFLALTSVCYSSGLNSFFATSYTGNILASANANEWIVTSPVSGNIELTAISAYNNTVIAVGNDGAIIRSINGSNWTRLSQTTLHNLKAINYDHDRWIAAGEYSTVLYSQDDGVTWTYAYTDTFRASANDGNTWVFVGDGGVIYNVYPASSLTQMVMADSKTTKNLYDVVYSSDLMQFVAVGANGTALTSSDGSTWNSHATGIISDLNKVIFYNHQYIAVGNDGVIITSPDGVIWTAQTSGTTQDLMGIDVFTDTTKYIAVGANGTIISSPNLVTWTAVNSGVSKNLNSIKITPTVAVIVGDGGIILSSPLDGGTIGVTWNNQTNSIVTTEILHHVNFITWTVDTVTYDDFVAVGNNGTIIASADGITWFHRNSPSQNHLMNVNFGINYFWIMGSVGYSTTYGADLNRLNYQSLAIQNNNSTGVNGPTLNASSFGVNQYVVTGQYDTILASIDGETFISQPTRTFHIEGVVADLLSMIFEDNQFTVVGNEGIILNSKDAITWSGSSHTFGNGKTIRTLQHKLDDFVSVKDFGANGDGLTDDTEAINRAMYEIYCRTTEPAARKVLYFPGGRYIISDSLKIPSNATLRGEGPGNTIITQDVNPDFVRFAATTADNRQQIEGQIGFNGADLPQNITISDMAFECPGDGFWVKSTIGLTLERVSITGNVTTPILSDKEYTGIYILGLPMAQASDINIIDCSIQNFNYGVCQPDGQYSRNIIFNSCKFFDMFQGFVMCLGDGMVNTMTISNNVFDLIYDKAIETNYATNITSTFNSYRDVANSYQGSGNANGYVIDFGVESVGCASINDQFDRSYEENNTLGNQWVNGNSNTSGWFGGHSLRVGLFGQQGGEKHILEPEQAAQPTGLSYSLNDNTDNQRIQYAIRRGYEMRSGILMLTYNGATGTYNLDDDYSETADVGVVFSLGLDGSNVALLYSSTTGGEEFEFVIAERYVKFAW